MGLIDIHAHLPVLSDILDERNLAFLEAGGVKISAEPPVEQLLAEMARGGVEKTVVVAAPPNEGIRSDNAALAQAISPHRDRLLGFGVLDPRGHKDIAGGVRRLVEEHGFCGVGELGYIDISHPQCFPLYEACIDMDLPILIHLGATLPSAPLRHARPILLDDVLVRYPELRVIAAHCGAPWVLEMVAVASRHQNVWMDVSALGFYPLTMQIMTLGAMLASGLAHRLVFGSDFPVTLPSRWAKRVRAAPGLTRANLHAIMEGNARMLLKL